MRILITGGSGQLGTALIAALDGHDVRGLGRADLDVANRVAVQEALASARPDVVVNAAAYTDVDGAERDPERAWLVNALAPQYLALACEQHGAALVHISTDYVFDGRKGSPYWEHDPVNPINAYGRSKLAGEVEVQRHCRRSYVVRTSWLYGHPGRNFVKRMLDLVRERDRVDVVGDEIGGPTWVVDLAAAIGKLISTECYGTYHLANEGACSRYEMARWIARQVGRESVVHATTTAEFRKSLPTLAPRPAHSQLKNFAAATGLGIQLRPWQDALGEFVSQLVERTGS